MIEFILSFIGGIISVLSPCIIPVLPIIFATSEGDWVRSFFVVLGMVTSFGILGLVLGILGSIFFLKYAAFAVLLILGLALLFNYTPEFRLVEMNRLFSYSKLSVYPFLLGISLGAVWAPCIGPILGAIIALATINASPLSGFLIMITYGAGMSSMTAFILFSGKKSGLFRKFSENQKTLNRIFGATILLILFLMVTGILDSFELFLIEKLGFFEEIFASYLKRV
jgi:cytochrome c biogenesis protein CcdA